MNREESSQGRKKSRIHVTMVENPESIPIARRTRGREEESLMEEYEEYKKEQKKRKLEKEENVVESRKDKCVIFPRIRKDAAVELDSDDEVLFIGEFSAGEIKVNTQQSTARKSVDSRRLSSPDSEVKDGTFPSERLDAKRKVECTFIVSDEEDNLSDREFRHSGNKKKNGDKFDVEAMIEDGASTEESTDEDNDDSDDDDYGVESSQTSESPVESDSDSSSGEDEETFAARKVVERGSGQKENVKRKYEILKCSKGNKLKSAGRVDSIRTSGIPVESDSESSSDEDEGASGASKVVDRGSQHKENGKRKDEILKCINGNLKASGRVDRAQTPVESESESESCSDEDEGGRHKEDSKRKDPSLKCGKGKLKSAAARVDFPDVLAKASVPLKFTFEVKDEPSDHAEELDYLWVQMNDGTKSSPDSDDGRVAETCSKRINERLKCNKEEPKSAKKVNLLDVLANSISDKEEVSPEALIPLTDACTPTQSQMNDVRVAETCSKRTNERSKCRKEDPKSAKKVDILNVLANSIFDKEQVSPEALMPLTDACTPTQSKMETLPRKFTFGVEKAPEKSEEEEEQEKLWADMDLELRSSKIGVANTIKVGDEEAKHKQVNLDGPLQCQQGRHELILDEQVGIICRYCNHVQTEIKHVTAPFLKDQPRRCSERYYGDGDFSEADDLCSEITNQSGSSAYPQTEGTVWENIRGVISSLYPHQREGFEFIWNNIAGGIYRDKAKNQSEGGRGCIISHAPGTGKTRLVIVFIQSYMKENPHCGPLIVAPRNMLLTWEEEFKKWEIDIPFYNLNKPEWTGNENPFCMRSLEKYRHGLRDMDMARRLIKLYTWKCDGGILGISYGLFKQLAGRYKNKDDCALSEKISKILLEIPELVVLDEGHTPRNGESKIWKVLTEIKTERRIILSGTPFQNNFDELFNTLSLVRPKFAESLRRGNQDISTGPKRGKKKNEGKQRWMTLSSSIAHKKSDDKELQKLKDIIKPFVHVHKGGILGSLPGLKRFMVVLKPTDAQKKLLDVLRQENQCFFSFEYLVSLISVHPSLVYACSDEGIGRDKIEMLKSVAGKDNSYKLNTDGVKARFVMELIRLSEVLNEKVIVFSQYIPPLNLIQDQLEAHLGWKEGTELLYMDGKRDVKQRQASIKSFNDPGSKAKVLLASIKACSEGIHLVGGSRVVLLDVTWNPSVEKQAISRAYRLGQSRVVYIYHLILSGSIDQKKYCRQTEKVMISDKVFSSSHTNEGNKRSDFCNVSEDRILEMMFDNCNLKPIFENISQPRESTDDANDMFS